MNETVEEFTRNRIKNKIKKCNKEEIHLFKRMYSHKDLDKDIEDVIDDMDSDDLDHALTQVENTIKLKD